MATFRVTGPLCVCVWGGGGGGGGGPPVTGEFPLQRPVTRGFDGFFLSAPEWTVV